MRRKTIISVFLFVIFYSVSAIVKAQPSTPGPDPDVPIDGGISILLAAGVTYVAKKGYDKRKKEKTASTNPDIIE